MNKAPMNIFKEILFDICFSLFGQIPRKGIAKVKNKSMFNFVRNSQFPPAMYENFGSSKTSVFQVVKHSNYNHSSL